MFFSKTTVNLSGKTFQIFSKNKFFLQVRQKNKIVSEYDATRYKFR